MLTERGHTLPFSGNPPPLLPPPTHTGPTLLASFAAARRGVAASRARSVISPHFYPVCPAAFAPFPMASTPIIPAPWPPFPLPLLSHPLI